MAPDPDTSAAGTPASDEPDATADETASDRDLIALEEAERELSDLESSLTDVDDTGGEAPAKG